MRVFLIPLLFLTNFVGGIEFDPVKAIDLLNDLVEHPKEVIEKLEKYKIADLLGALGFHSNVNLTISPKCHEELTFLGYGMIDSARHVKHGTSDNTTMTSEERKNYLIPMMDSAGKIGSGIARGHLTNTGQFTQCKNVQMFSTTLNRTVRGDYYRVLFDVKMRSYLANGSCLVPQIGLDLCLPYVCVGEDLTSYFREALSFSIDNSPVCAVVNVNQRVPKPSIATFFVAGILLCIVVLCITSGIVDYFYARRFAKVEYKRIDETSSVLWKMFMSFSMYRNIKEIFRVKNCNKGNQVTSLNCIRTISTVWVISGHCSAIMVLICTNPIDLIDYTKTYIGLFVANAYFAVDTFFFISAFLLAFLWFRQLNRNRNSVMTPLSWVKFYVHRILRISPVYYITIFFFTFIFTRMLRDSPIYMSPALDDSTCEKNFWLNLLYINNIFDTKHICYVISWYLATDLQIYFFTPLVLIPFAVGGRVAGLLVASFIFMVSTVFNSYQMLVWHFPPTQFQFGPKDPRYDPNARRFDQWNYYNPLVRCQIYIMGLILGYFMQQYPKVQINKWLDRVMWVISLSTMLFVVLSLQNYTAGNLWSPIENTMYSSAGRVLWGLGLGWVIFSTYHRKSMIRDFMSLPIWTPLARVSFCAYLIHIMACAMYFGKNYSEVYFSTHFLVDSIIPVTVLSFTGAIFWSSFFEMPFAKLESLLLMGPSKPKSKSISPSDLINETQGIHKIPVNFPDEELNNGKPIKF